ncbi:RHS repeat-associated core domain-containing protein [Pseudomonas sp. NFACC13-1]|uniref:RHS repeat-associated core domain-containing protein n=1 Tax=Pseudomonas sp. NFACC13-1 TaxID=1566245 RepID=UPI001C40B026|nr:RHS repeat-associated core domain-containing protein [Pseudomonas sp. NFACC13-1]
MSLTHKAHETLEEILNHHEYGVDHAAAKLLTGGVDEVFSRTEASGSTYSYLVDALGSTQALSDSTGASTTQYTYEPYGQTSSSGSASTNSQQYTGRENDGTGVYYYRARYYQSGFGRFISGDPIGLAGGINMYTYVEGNPIYSTDPLGLMCFDFDKFTNEIEQNRADSALTLGSLLTTEAIGTMPKTSNEMRALGPPKGEINPWTSQLSRWSGRFKTRALRIIGRTPTVMAASTVATERRQ